MVVLAVAHGSLGVVRVLKEEAVEVDVIRTADFVGISEDGMCCCCCCCCWHVAGVVDVVLETITPFPCIAAAAAAALSPSLGLARYRDLLDWWSDALYFRPKKSSALIG